MTAAPCNPLAVLRFEGNGVPPDVVCEPKAGDFVGTTDTALEQALIRLR